MGGQASAEKAEAGSSKTCGRRERDGSCCKSRLDRIVQGAAASDHHNTAHVRTHHARTCTCAQSSRRATRSAPGRSFVYVYYVCMRLSLSCILCMYETSRWLGAHLELLSCSLTAARHAQLQQAILTMDVGAVVLHVHVDLYAVRTSIDLCVLAADCEPEGQSRQVPPSRRLRGRARRTYQERTSSTSLADTSGGAPTQGRTALILAR